MKTAYYTFCPERRKGIERRSYQYDMHLPDRRSTDQRRNGRDRREIRYTPRILEISCELCDQLHRGDMPEASDDDTCRVKKAHRREIGRRRIASNQQRRTPGTPSSISGQASDVRETDCLRDLDKT